MFRVAVVSELSRAVWVTLFLSCLGGACTTDHDAFARKPAGGSSSGGTGGATSGFAAGGFGNAGNPDQGGRPNPDYEPPGDNVLTVVNGVIDASSVALCWARVSADAQSFELVGSPSPELAYGASTILTSIDGLSLLDDTIQPWVIAGDLSRLKKLDCAEAVDLAQSTEAEVTPIDDASEGEASAGAGGAAAQEPLEEPALRARPLAALPPGTVNVGRSLALVLSGCLGGAYYRDALETSLCGADYTPETPTVAPVVVTLSRHLDFGKVGLQGLHASPATGALDLRVSGESGAVALGFASGLTFGTIKPRPADVRFSPTELGVQLSDYGLQVQDRSGEVVHQAAWPDVFAVTGIEPLRESRTYTVIVLGPDPSLEVDLLRKRTVWWNEPAFAVIDNDPTRE